MDSPPVVLEGADQCEGWAGRSALDLPELSGVIKVRAGEQIRIRAKS